MTDMRPVRELADQIRGVTYAKEDASPKPTPGSVAVLRAGNIEGGELTFDDLVYVPRHRVADEQMLRRYDILVATSSGSLDVVGKTAQARTNLDVAFGAFCKVLRPTNAIDPRYLGHFFHTPHYRTTISSLAAGANINNLRTAHLNELMVPVPPDPLEQRRIADILDKADAIRRKRREAIALTEELLRSAFLEMFGDPMTNPKGWANSPFGELVSETQLGLVRAASEQGPERAYPYVRMNAIRGDGHLELSGATRVDASGAEVRSCRLREGDFLFNTRNSRELVGKSAVFHGSEPFLFNNNILRVRFRPGVEPDFVNAYWQTSRAQQQLEARKAGTTSVFAIYYKALITLPVPMPPPSLQAKFADICAATRQSLVSHANSAREAETLFGALLHRSFGVESSVAGGAC